MTDGAPGPRSRVLRLPSRGRLLIGTDLHGNLRDFHRLAQRFLDAGNDAWLVLTGDLVHGPDPATVAHWPTYLGTPYEDETPALLDAFRELQRARPGRVHCLLGNHDHAHVGGPTTPKFYDDERAALEARLSAAQVRSLVELLSSFPLVAVAPCGVVLSHAAPAAPIDSPDDLERLRLDGLSDLPFHYVIRTPILGPLLWARSASRAQSSRFLSALGGTVAVYGHDVVRQGFARGAHDQICVSTSFALHDDRKTYVDLDLARDYPDAEALREGVELRPLWPEAG